MAQKTRPLQAPHHCGEASTSLFFTDEILDWAGTINRSMVTQQMRNGCILVMDVKPGPVSSNGRPFTIPFRLSLAFYNPTDLQSFGRTPWISVNCKHSAKLKFHLLSIKKSSPRIIKMKICYRLQIFIDCFINGLCKYIISRYGNIFNVQSIESCVMMKYLFLFSSHPLHPEFQDKELPKNRKWHIPSGASAHYKKI